MKTRVLLIGGTGNNLFQLSYALNKLGDRQALVFLRPTPAFTLMQRAFLRADARSPDLALQYLEESGHLVEDMRASDMLRLGLSFASRRVRQAFQWIAPLNTEDRDYFIDTTSFIAGYFQTKRFVDLDHLKIVAKEIIAHFRNRSGDGDSEPLLLDNKLVVHFRGGDNKDSSWANTCAAMRRIITGKLSGSVKGVVIVGRYLSEAKDRKNWPDLGADISLVFHDSGTEIEDLILFSQAQHLLVDQSSFSYFGALGNAEGDVFTPCALSNYPFQPPTKWDAA